MKQFSYFLVLKSSLCLLQRMEGSERRDNPLTTFTVAPRKKYRFRVAYAGGGRSCPITVSVANHVLRVISLDGNPIKPRDVASFVMAAGQKTPLGFGINLAPGHDAFLDCRWRRLHADIVNRQSTRGNFFNVLKNSLAARSRLRTTHGTLVFLKKLEGVGNVWEGVGNISNVVT